MQPVNGCHGAPSSAQKMSISMAIIHSHGKCMCKLGVQLLGAFCKISLLAKRLDADLCSCTEKPKADCLLDLHLHVAHSGKLLV